MQSEYDAFAPDYHWLFSDYAATSEAFYQRYREVFESLPPDASILDCACGTGLQALALARQGYRVRGTDASGGMIEQAREGLAVRFDRASWEDLPRTLSERFDLAICCGNSIGHCRDEGEMTRSLRGIRDVLKEGSAAIVDSRNWEKVLAERPRFQALTARKRGGVRCLPLYVWSLPDKWGEPVVIEIVLIFEEGDRTSCRSHRFTYYPFRVGELIARLKAAGFIEVETDYSETKDLYSVTACREP